MDSTFDQSSELFPEKLDSYLQPETQGVSTWRRLRNTRDLTPDREQMASSLGGVQEGGDTQKTGGDRKGRAKRKIVIPYRYNFVSIIKSNSCFCHVRIIFLGAQTAYWWCDGAETSKQHKIDEFFPSLSTNECGLLQAAL